MNRRYFLRLLAGLPFIGAWFRPTLAEQPFTTACWVRNEGVYYLSIWNCCLTPDEIKALSSGVSPLQIQPRELQQCTPLLGGKVETKWHHAAFVEKSDVTKRVYLNS